MKSNFEMVRTISKLLFTDYLWPFEILSVFMLALIVAIYALARPETPEEEAIVDAERREQLLREQREVQV